jgi:hypothetical protein
MRQKGTQQFSIIYYITAAASVQDILNQTCEKRPFAKTAPPKDAKKMSSQKSACNPRAAVLIYILLVCQYVTAAIYGGGFPVCL